jgi:predicted protein tyrosine phosphatase
MSPTCCGARCRSRSERNEPIDPLNLLFVCSKNRQRSPTAAHVVANDPEFADAGYEALSAGLNADSDTPLTPDLIRWADVVLVMEPGQRTRLSRRFGAHLRGKRVVCLSVPDRFEVLDPELIELLRRRLRQHLR